MVFWSQTHLFCSNLMFQNEEFLSFSACPLSVRKYNWSTIESADPRNNYAVALEKPAVKPVARLHNIITSCQWGRVWGYNNLLRMKQFLHNLNQSKLKCFMIKSLPQTTSIPAFIFLILLSFLVDKTDLIDKT